MENQALENIKKKVSKFPDTPGVYIFKSTSRRQKAESKILYIGKATSLKDRVRSYFSTDIVNTRGLLIYKMLGEFTDIDFIKTDSVLEALILEANLIKKHQPEANTIDKDDKSFNYVVITKEDFPRVLVVRGRELEKFTTIYRSKFKNEKLDILYSFGPFTNGGQLKEALKLVRKIFPYRDKCLPFQDKPLALRSLGEAGCFNRQIGLCPGVCTGEISKVEYAKQIRNIVLFFEGKKKQLVKNLEKQMKSFAKNREFEKANIAKHTLFALNHIRDVALIKSDLCHGVNENNFPHQSASGLRPFRIESYDIAHMSGENVVGVMTVVEDGEINKSEYRKFSARGGSAFGGKTVLGNGKANDSKALKEVLSRRLAHIEWRMPNLIVVDGGVAQKNAIEKILDENGVQIPVVSVVKDERHKPKEILGDKKWLKFEREILLSNNEAHRFAIGYHRKLRGRIE